MLSLYRLGTGPSDHERPGLPGGPDVRRSRQTVSHTSERRTSTLSGPIDVRPVEPRPVRLVHHPEQRERLLRNRVESAPELRRQSRLTSRQTLQLNRAKCCGRYLEKRVLYGRYVSCTIQTVVSASCSHESTLLYSRHALPDPVSR